MAVQHCSKCEVMLALLWTTRSFHNVLRNIKVRRYNPALAGSFITEIVFFVIFVDAPTLQLQI